MLSTTSGLAYETIPSTNAVIAEIDAILADI